MIDKQRLEEKCSTWNIALTGTQLDQLDAFAQILVDYNQKVNLTAITDPEGIEDKHFLDSLLFALPMLAEYCLPLVKVGGNFLAMKGASGEEELTAARGAIKKLGGEYRETRTLHLPGGDTRTLILCKKISQTPTAYPRNGGKIAKSPLK